MFDDLLDIFQMMLLGSLVVLALVSGLKCHPVGYQAEDGATACEQLTRYTNSLYNDFNLPDKCTGRDSVREGMGCKPRQDPLEAELTYAMDVFYYCEGSGPSYKDCVKSRVSTLFVFVLMSSIPNVLIARFLSMIVRVPGWPS